MTNNELKKEYSTLANIEPAKRTPEQRERLKALSKEISLRAHGNDPSKCPLHMTREKLIYSLKNNPKTKDIVHELGLDIL